MWESKLGVKLQLMVFETGVLALKYPSSLKNFVRTAKVKGISLLNLLLDRQREQDASRGWQQPGALAHGLAHTQEVDVIQGRIVGRAVLQTSTSLKSVIVHIACQVCKHLCMSYSMHSWQSLENIIFVGTTFIVVWSDIL